MNMLTACCFLLNSYMLQAQTQALDGFVVVEDKVVFLIQPYTPNVLQTFQTVQTTHYSRTVSPYSPSLFTSALRGNLFNENYYIDMTFYNNANQLGTIRFFYGIFPKLPFKVLSLQSNTTLSQLFDLIRVTSPNFSFSFTLYRQEAVQAIANFRRITCGLNMPNGIEGNITITPTNTPVIIQKQNNTGTWITIRNLGTAPFKTTTNGQYRVTNQNGTVINVFTFTNLMGCLANIGNSNMVAYPNPFANTIQLSYTLAEKTLLDIDIVDMLGKHVAIIAKQQEVEKGEFQKNIDLTNQPRGIYFVRIHEGNHKQLLKIIKTE